MGCSAFSTIVGAVSSDTCEFDLDADEIVCVDVFVDIGDDVDDDSSLSLSIRFIVDCFRFGLLL
jgi:hypothetical protein